MHGTERVCGENEPLCTLQWGDSSEPMSSPPHSDHTSHYAATAAELVLWSLLLWRQGIVETTPRLRVRWGIWCTRVTARFGRWPRGAAARFALAVGLIGTGVLAAVGYATGFLHGPHAPPGWQRTLATLAVTLVAPSLIVCRHTTRVPPVRLIAAPQPTKNAFLHA